MIQNTQVLKKIAKLAFISKVSINIEDILRDSISYASKIPILKKEKELEIILLAIPKSLEVLETELKDSKRER